MSKVDSSGATRRALQGARVNNIKFSLKHPLEAFWPCIQPQRILLLLDAWSPNKDEQLFDEAKSPLKSCVRRIIPAGATGLVQPLDIYLFRPYKNFVKMNDDNIQSN